MSEPAATVRLMTALTFVGTAFAAAAMLLVLVVVLLQAASNRSWHGLPAALGGVVLMASGLVVLNGVVPLP